MVIFYFQKLRITSSFFLKLCGENKFIKTFAFEHKINKSNAEVSTYY